MTVGSGKKNKLAFSTKCVDSRTFYGTSYEGRTEKTVQTETEAGTGEEGVPPRSRAGTPSGLAWLWAPSPDAAP